MPTDAISLRNLFKEVTKKKTYVEIATEAGIETRYATARLSEALNKNASIDYHLADYILQETVFAGDPVARAVAILKAAGLAAPLASSYETLIRNSLDTAPATTQIPELHRQDAKTPRTPGKETRNAEPGTQNLPDERRAKINRRAELATFRIARHEAPGARKLPKWLHLAAGSGMELEQSPDFLYFEQLPESKDIHSAVVSGDSMAETLQAGDIVILQECLNGRLELPELEDKAEKATLSQWKRESGIRDGDIAVVSINREAPTLKRIFYDVERGEKNWKMQIVADNARAWRHGRPFQVALGDKIVFHAKLIGIGEEPLLS